MSKENFNVYSPTQRDSSVDPQDLQDRHSAVKYIIPDMKAAQSQTNIFDGVTEYYGIVITPVVTMDSSAFSGLIDLLPLSLQPETKKKFKIHIYNTGPVGNPCEVKPSSNTNASTPETNNIRALQRTLYHPDFVATTNIEFNQGDLLKVVFDKSVANQASYGGTVVAKIMSTVPESACSGSAAAFSAGAGATLGATGGTPPYPAPKQQNYKGQYGPLDVENGRLPAKILQIVPGLGNNHKFLVDVVADLTNLTAAFKARFGMDIILTDYYRTYAGQVEAKNKWIALSEPKKAATPGTSNHGWGLAFDFDHKDESYTSGNGASKFVGVGDSKASGFDSIVYKWLFANAPTYKFHNPSWARPGSKNPEAWHFESIKTVKDGLYGTVEQADGD